MTETKILFIGSLYKNPDPSKHEFYYKNCLQTLKTYKTLFPNSQFALHIDTSLSEQEIAEISNYAMVYIHKYVLNKRDYNKVGFTTESSVSVRKANAGKITKAMRLSHLFFPTWNKSFDFAISIDVHDDLSVNSKLIDRYIEELKTTGKLYSFTYWKSTEKTCFHEINREFHFHLDAGLLIVSKKLPGRSDISYEDFVFGLVMKHRNVINKGLEEVLLDLYLDSIDFYKNNDDIIFHEHRTKIRNFSNVSNPKISKKRKQQNRITINHEPTKQMEILLGSVSEIYVCTDRQTEF